MGNDEFLLRAGIEEYSISLRPFGARPDASGSAQAAARAVFELRFGLESGCPEVVSVARGIAAAIGGGPASSDPAGGSEVTELVNLLERELFAGRLVVHKNVTRSLSDRRVFDESEPLPPAPRETPETPTSSYDVKVIDDTGAAVSGVDVNLIIDGEPETLTTGGGGTVHGEGHTKSNASLRMLDVTGLAEKLEPRWSEPRSEKLPKGPDVSEVTAGKPFAPLSVKPDVPFTLILARTPRGILEVTHLYHDDSPIQGAEYEVEFADGSVRKGKISAPGKLLITDAPLGTAKVRFGQDERPWERAVKTANPEYGGDLDALIEKRLAGAA